MKIFNKNLDHDIAVVAEIGINHEGNFKVAARMIEMAAEAGADAVKLQSYTPARYASASDRLRLERVTRFSLSFKEHEYLAEVARVNNIDFFSTPLTEDWVEKLEPMVSAIKIASGDLNFEPVIRAAAKTKHPVLLSTGLGTLDEIDQAVEWLMNEMGERDFLERVVLFQCVSAYPTPIEEAEVRVVPFLKDRYGCAVGFSNHVLEPEASYAAVALGAQVVECHFTDCKTDRDFRDHALSLEASDLGHMIKTLNLIKKSLGGGVKRRMPSELPNLLAVRKGVVAAHYIKAGSTLSEENLMYARPATEFSASEIKGLLGKKVLTDIEQGELVSRSAVYAKVKN
ncbi:N-acetylneuraminate synthase family protein [Thalassospira alkalitolerans]|uniref:N-acetylneuraminate synthase family protein n=1 Tax=Thalassospira alkalitolerans TaxID=1293890 RepID=UPI0030EE956F|tara:strand:- start:42250 stop:43275 length:1026 start_codon:yes stop_codon:yes gene_type:complete